MRTYVDIFRDTKSACDRDDARGSDLQGRLDAVWAAVNVLGAPDSACITNEERAYCQAIGDALAEIERLGGRPS